MAPVSSAPIDKYLRELAQHKATDLLFTVGSAPAVRVDGDITPLRRGSLALALRLIPFQIPSFEDLGVPPTVASWSTLYQGLVLVTGPTGSGKSTTLAAMIDSVNTHRACHVLTIEDPVEYVHEHKRSLVNQRELGTDCVSFARALRSALREDPDVLLVGEMRDPETIQAVLTIAETGHLVFSTVHTNDAAQALDRIVDVFSGDQQNQIRNQIATGSQFGMSTLESSLSDLISMGIISYDEALNYSLYPKELASPSLTPAPQVVASSS